MKRGSTGAVRGEAAAGPRSLHRREGYRMDHSDTTDLADTFRARGAAIADACTRCGDCFRACPMTGPAGIGEADPSATAGAIVDLITGGDGNEAAIRWGEACSGSGYCIPACKHGINPRFMVQLARGYARLNAGSGHTLAGRWGGPFRTMSRGVRVLSRLQIPPETLARFAPSREPRTQPARRGLLYRLQRPEDAAHRAALPRHSRPARGRLRGDGRGRPMLRRVSVSRRRFCREQQGRLRDDRRAGLGRGLDRAGLVSVVPDLDRRGVAAELRNAVRQQAVRPEPVSDVSRRPCRPPRRR